MPWDRPTLKQLYERTSQDFSGRLLDGRQVLSRSVIAVLAKVWSGACHHLHGMLEWIFRQVFVDVCEGWALERWAAVWGIYCKAAAAAEGEVVFSGAEGAVIPAGTIVQHQVSGQQYATRADGTVELGTVTVRVKALLEGVGGNLPGGAALSLISPLSGLQAEGRVVGVGGISGGVAEEEDDSLRARLLARLRKPPRGGAKHDYEAWALEVAGVTRAWCYPLYLGAGTVAVTFVTDNAPGGPIPTREMLDRVREHIDPLRPATVKEFSVFAPEALNLHIKLSISPDTTAVRDAVRAELGDLIAREGYPGAVILRSHITEAISLAAGENDHLLIEPAGNIVVPADQFPILDTVEFVAMPGAEGGDG